MRHLQGKIIRAIEGNWEHILNKHGLTKAEIVSVFFANALRPQRNKKHRSARYRVTGHTYTGKTVCICYSWCRPHGTIWIYTAF